MSGIVMDAGVAEDFTIFQRKDRRPQDLAQGALNTGSQFDRPAGSLGGQSGLGVPPAPTGLPR